MKRQTSLTKNTYDYEKMDLEIYGSDSQCAADFLATEIAENAIPESTQKDTK